MVSAASGSAHVELQNTKVLAAVYGPKHSSSTEASSELGVLTCHVKYASFSDRSKSQEMASEKKREDEYRALNAWLQDALEASVIRERFPKSVVEVHINVLEADGGELSAAVLAASVALAEARIEIRDIITCLEVARVNSLLLSDPTAEELKKSDATLMIAYASTLGEVCNITQTGSLDAAQFNEMCSISVNGCKLHSTIVQQRLKKSMKKRLKSI